MSYSNTPSLKKKKKKINQLMSHPNSLGWDELKPYD